MIFKGLVVLWFFTVGSCTEFHNELVKDITNNLMSIEEKMKKTFNNTDNEANDAILHMIDASSKIPPGLFGGSFMDLGNFDECYNIAYQDIYGKYCLGRIPITTSSQKYHILTPNITELNQIIGINPEPRMIGLGEDYLGIYFAVCVPSSWQASDIPNFGVLSFTEDFCHSKATEPELSDGAIATIAVWAFFLAIAVVSTAYDIYLYYTEQKSHELLVAFSFLSNGLKLFKTSNNKEQLLCLNGIKAISMFWVVLGHEYNNLLLAALSNYLDISKWKHNSANMLVMGATVSVDTFFAVGGLVTVYTFLKSVDKGVKFNIALFYIHRYLRLTPVLIMLSIIHLDLINHFGNGPLWNIVDLALVQSCKTGWWSTFLYITNYVREGNCLSQTWYLSVDMQLYILSPLLLIPLKKWPKWTLRALIFLAITGCIIPFGISYGLNLASLMSALKSNAYMSEYYMQTYARFGPYVIGMIAGYFLYKIKTGELKIKFNKWQVLLLWLICLTGLTACVYAEYPLDVATKEDRWGNAFFTAFNRPAWAVFVCCVVFLCVTGYGGPIDAFLSHPVFQFLTKLSYSIYLIHFSVITLRNASMTTLIKFSNMEMFHVFWGDFMFTLGLALISCLMFESPIIIIEKYLFGTGAPLTKEPKKEALQA